MTRTWVEKSQSQDGRVNFVEPGQEVIGTLKTIDEITLFDRPIKRATVLTTEGPRNFLLTTQLQNLLSEVPVNTDIRVQFQGEKKTKRGAKMKVFKLWVLQENATPEEAKALVGNPNEF